MTEETRTKTLEEKTKNEKGSYKILYSWREVYPEPYASNRGEDLYALGLTMLEAEELTKKLNEENREPKKIKREYFSFGGLGELKEIDATRSERYYFEYDEKIPVKIKRVFSITPAENLEKVVYQEWEESERGWGTSPYGYSLHLNNEKRKKYIENYWKDQPDTIPDEYSRPCGSPKDIYVDKNTFQELKTQEGLRFSD